MPDHHELANLVWQIADLLRGPYTPPQYERVMLPMTVLRRFDCVLAGTKDKVLAEYARRKDGKLLGDGLDQMLNKVAKQRFHNRSPLDFDKLKGDPDNIEKHLVSYIKGFSANVRTIFDYFEFEKEIEKMRESNILYLIVSKFSEIPLHPTVVRSEEMGLIFENLIRRFYEQANETAGDHFTPREIIRLMAGLLFINDDELLGTPGTVRKMLDPTCGTGGMLAEAQNYMREHHAAAQLYTYGQDYNKRAFATAASEMLLKEVVHTGSSDNVRFGDIFTDDKFSGETFDYVIANPPFGVDWKKQQREVTREHESGRGRFNAGLPRVNDGSLLFVQHMTSKFEPVLPHKNQHGSRMAVVLSGSPLFTGGAGSGESDIRKWIIESDWLEAIIALPEQMFYNTGIGTYIWIITNRKEKRRKGKIQLLDARSFWQPGGSEENRRSLGDKRRHISTAQIEQIVKLYDRHSDAEHSKTFDNADFGYTRVTVERPLRLRYQMSLDAKSRFLDACPHLLHDVQEIDKQLGRDPRFDWNEVSTEIEGILRARKSRWKAAEEKLFRNTLTIRDPSAERVIAGKSTLFNADLTLAAVERQDSNRGSFPRGPKGISLVVRYEPDSELRDLESVPLKEDIDAYFEREVLPHVPDAWMDRDKDKIGYEINFNRHFYQFTPPRELAEIDAEIEQAEKEFMRLFKEVTK